MKLSAGASAAALVVGLAMPVAVGRAQAATTSVASSAPTRAGTAAAITVRGTTHDGPRVIKYTVSTPSLAMSTKTPVSVDVVLPAGYSEHPHRRYPVLYELPGTSNTANEIVNNTRVVALTQKLGLIVVIPDGGYNGDGGGFYTDWVDESTRLGVENWETFHTRELVPWIDTHFRTKRSRAGRAITGVSQGGFGSMSYAARHPDLYGAAAAFSGAVDIHHGPVCAVGADVLISAIMTGLNQVEPFAPFGNPLTDAANWKAHDPGSIIGKLDGTRIDLYTSTGVPAVGDLSSVSVLGTATMEALLHQSNLCFKRAADNAGVAYHWHGYLIGTHDWRYAVRSLADYLPRVMSFFRTGR
ncbi:alpha/beta hydrolase [Actinoallomurus iriomotensis]|uniref:Esterase n=1 Tax=Actinoallomurus iriomotensis TaxID=478107 RepID=A0A9W6S506_9ACTN|nr:alpha/beta hydrolase family protein [Actinoallomurus iriomotensis]GLY88395.1 hypothetical protein Airi02_063240 [Actinoallomurus iriomotensis]